MRLQYSVLWVDDQKEKFEKLKYDQQIKEFIESLFFCAHLTFVETVTEAINAVEESKFDVIFSDCNIGEDEKGDEFIKTIREHNVNTEVLFYSAQEEVKALNVDRISFFNIPERSGYQELLIRMKNLILLTVEKLQDLTNLRGLVMAETSELDKKMEDICLAFFVNKKTDKSEACFEEILKGLETDYLNNLKKSDACDKKCTHKIRNKGSIEKIITNISFDSARKARAIKKIIEECDVSFEKYPCAKDFFESYRKDIIDIRNLLAHSYSRINDDSKEVLVSKKDGQEISFNEECIKDTRGKILLYEHLLNDLYDVILKN